MLKLSEMPAAEINLLPPKWRVAPSFSEIGAKGSYWLCPVGFFGFFSAALWGLRVEPGNEGLFVTSALLFGLAGAFSILWPALQVREENRAFQTRVGFKQRQLNGVFIPHSKTTAMVFKWMTPLVLLISVSLIVSSNDAETQIKGTLAVAGYGFVMALFVWKGISRQLTRLFSRRPLQRNAP